MTQTNSLPVTVDEAWLAMLSAGTLPPHQQLLLECQAELRPELRSLLAAGDHIAGALLESAKGTPLSSGFMQVLEQRLATAQIDTRAAEKIYEPGSERPEWMPPALDAYMRRSGTRLKWRNAGLGVQQARLSRTTDGRRLYLLKARPGTPLPRHSHRGQEWTLLLAGGYKSGPDQYVAGDLHQEDEACTHDLRIDTDGPCIALIADEGRLRFPNPLLRLLQPFVGL